jgi:hypothetical protein
MIQYDAISGRKANWPNQLNIYETQLNDRPKEILGMYMYSPFEVFFGRPKVFSESKTSDYIHEPVRKATKQLNERVKRYQEKRLNTPKYRNGDIVIVKAPSWQKTKLNSKVRFYKGLIIKKNLNPYKYKVCYSTTNGQECKWFHISNIIAATKRLQTQREKEMNLREKLSAPLEHVDRLEHLSNDFGLDIIYDPPGDGNCLFNDVSNQLECLGIMQTHEQLGNTSVQYLYENTRVGPEVD